jgi:predicted MPP superfamily phosphohydrolase
MHPAAPSPTAFFIEEILIPGLMLALLVASQIFWIRRIRAFGRRFLARPAARTVAGAAAFAVYAFIMLYNFVPFWWMRAPAHTQLTARDVLLDAPFYLWVFGSVIGFLLLLILRLPLYFFRLGHWIYRLMVRALPALRVSGAGAPSNGAADPPSPTVASRRRFLEQATVAAGTIPFAWGLYGLVFGRLELETTSYRLDFERLPRGFAGFRIAQLSDIHIGPYMTAREIRQVVETTNRLKADLILLTGDYVIWDGSTQYAVVDALSGLRAPYGVFGCLGNHDAWARVTGSITGLFAAQGTRILRKENVALRAGDDEINLIGVDYQTHHPAGEHYEGIVREYLDGVEPLVRRDTLNVLMSHNPNTFDRAAGMGIDLSLAGHTHGGQVTLEFINPALCPSRLVTPYIKGWFEKPGGRMYVNRGIGTIGVPMRMGAPPEITVYELGRKA